jgi:hypothetical protein
MPMHDDEPLEAVLTPSARMYRASAKEAPWRATTR